MPELRKPSSRLLNTLATNVRSLRLMKKLSQERLAEESGLHRTYIGAVERSEKNVSLSTLEALASAFSISPADLLMEKGANEK